MYQLLSVRHSWPEQADFTMQPPPDGAVYTFLHFFNSVDIMVDGKMVTTRPHACIVYTPGIKRYYTCSTPLLYDWFHFTMEDPLPEGLQCNTLFYPSDYSFITAIIWEAEKEFYTQKLYRETVINIKLQELFIKLSRADEESTSFVINRQTRLAFQKLRNDIFSNLSERIDVAQMAKQAYLGTTQFHNIYRNLFGRSPMEDFIAARIHAAANELLNTNKSIAVIAEELGYSNPSHFSRQFREQTGMSPSQYRKADSLYPLPKKNTNLW